MPENGKREWENRFRAAVNPVSAWGSKSYYCINGEHLVHVGNRMNCPECAAPMAAAVGADSRVLVQCTRCSCQAEVVPGGELAEMPFGPLAAELLNFEWSERRM